MSPSRVSEKVGRMSGQINRTNFSPGKVLRALEDDEVDVSEMYRLLVEACHVIVDLRERHGSALTGMAHAMNALDRKQSHPEPGTLKLQTALDKSIARLISVAAKHKKTRTSC